MDNTVDIVKSWIKKDHRIRLYSNEQLNFIKALNLGLKKSLMVYIFLSSKFLLSFVPGNTKQEDKER